MIFFIIHIVLRGGGVGRSVKPHPQLSYDFYKDLLMLWIGDTRLVNNKPLKITAAPIIVFSVVDDVI